jgi:hypothetical protein
LWFISVLAFVFIILPMIAGILLSLFIWKLNILVKLKTDVWEF